VNFLEAVNADDLWQCVERMRCRVLRENLRIKMRIEKCIEWMEPD